MNFKKCSRCGCFFVSEGSTCIACSPKDKLEISKLRNYLDNGNYSNSITSISVDTGISVKNLNRYLENEEFSGKLNGNITL